MVKDIPTTEQPIQLTFRSETTVTVEPEDQDRFVITSREAAYACKKASDEKGWQKQFEAFLIELERWSEAHTDRVSATYVYVGDGQLNVVVRTVTDTYDMDFDDDLSNLDIQLVEKFDWLHADVMQIPHGLYRPSLSKAIQVYGDGKRSRPSGGA